jgi:uncharacterized membrane protein
MIVLVLGIVCFFGIHSIRIFGSGLRDSVIARVGQGPYRGIYSLFAVGGLALIVWGFRLARQEPVFLWWPPLWTRHLASLLVLVAFVFVTAAYVPNNHIKAKLGHPMVLGVKTWAFAHLMSNGKLADVVLFGAALLWAILDFRSARRRGPLPKMDPKMSKTLLTIAIGAIGWVAVAFWLHQLVIGVRPL